MKLSHPAVLLFGAGATRGGFEDKQTPPPVDSDFFEIAGHVKGHGTQRLAATVLKDVWKLYGRTTNIGLESYYRDIETRAKISSFAKTANKPKDWEKRTKNLQELIRRVLIHTTCDSTDDHFKPVSSKPHSDILNRLDGSDTLLTFNYDLVIEESFKNADLWTPVGGYGDQISGVRSVWSKNWLKNRGANTTTKTNIPLFKLHGSINWAPGGPGVVAIKDRPLLVRSKKNRIISEIVSILPPGWNKRIDKNPYKEFWREARLELERCSSIVIIGYSLPETDLLAKALFSEIVRLRAARKNYIKQLHIADPLDSVQMRLIDTFNAALNSQSKVFRYKNIKEFAKRCMLDKNL